MGNYLVRAAACHTNNVRNSLQEQNKSAKCATRKTKVESPEQRELHESLES